MTLNSSLFSSKPQPINRKNNYLETVQTATEADILAQQLMLLRDLRHQLYAKNRRHRTANKTAQDQLHYSQTPLRSQHTTTVLCQHRNHSLRGNKASAAHSGASSPVSKHLSMLQPSAGSQFLRNSAGV